MTTIALINMFPCEVMNDVKEVRNGCVVLSRKPPTTHSKSVVNPYRTHCFLRQFVEGALLTLGIPPFINRIPNIFSVSSKEKMIGIDAARSITRVANAWSFVWNVTATQNPRNSIAKHAFALPSTDNSVSTSVYTPSPKPARIRLFNLRPKAIWESLIKAIRGKYRITVQWNLLFFNLAKLCGSGKFFMHKSVHLICATLRGAQTPPRHFYYGSPFAFSQQNGGLL